MTGPDFEKAVVALTAWREAEGDGLNAQLAVVFVLRTRAEAGWNHGSIYFNAIAKNQFSSMSISRDPRTIAYPDPRNPQFQSLLQKVDQIYDGAKDLLTNGALYFANLANVTSGWFQDTILAKPDEHPRVAEIGRTTFFK